MNSSLPLVICLMGPTASGKTHLAIELAQKLCCDIISVDSAMVYRGMDIGTAKPTPAEQKIAPHQLIDICDPQETYSAGRFRTNALAAIDTILQRGRIPLLVGGTMLYFSILQKGLAQLPQANDEIRAQLAQRANQEGWSELHQQLITVDPILSTYIHVNDKQRIARALEIYQMTGQRPSKLFSEQTAPDLPYRLMNIIVAGADRQLLHEKITRRFERMLQQGFIAEVEKLYQQTNLHADLPALRSVGYRQIWAYLAGELSYDEMYEQSLIATRQLAKRQMTWLRSWHDAHWFDSEADNLVNKVCAIF